MTENDDLVFFNGVDGLTGTYTYDPLPVKDLANYAYGAYANEDAELRAEQKRRGGVAETSFRPPSDLNDNDLSQVGWGVIFAEDADTNMNAAIREALSPLLKLRQSQAGTLYREFLGQGLRGTEVMSSQADARTGYLQGESKRQFITRHGAPIAGITNPEKMPTYLLLVGDPHSIPLLFQYELDIDYYVGRIHFATLDEYASYARSVVAAETGQVKLAPNATLFSVRNDNDGATKLSHERLMQPMFERLKATRHLVEEGLRWNFQFIGGEEATRERLGSLLGGDETPALLFTASHGMEYRYPKPEADKLRLPHTGAIICRDWPGRWYSGPIDPDWFFSADKVEPDANLLGTIAFHFACFGAGTPYLSDHFRKDGIARGPISPHAFMAALPQKLLGHPRGGALAVIGHIDRAWNHSFFWQTPSIDTMRSMLVGMLMQNRVGKAMDDMNLRYAQLGAELSNIIEQSLSLPDADMVSNWTAHNDARSYIVVGDPAVRMPVVAANDPALSRPMLDAQPALGGSVPLVLVSSAMPQGSLALDGSQAGDGGQPVSTAPAAVTNQGTSTTAQPQPAQALPAHAVPETAFSTLFGQEKATDLKSSLGTVMTNLGSRLAEFTNNIATLEVSTYVVDELESLRTDPNTGQPVTGARQAALTRLSLDGDMKVYIPKIGDEIDTPVWEIHMKMVEQAQTQRTKMIQMTLEVLSNLLPKIRG